MLEKEKREFQLRRRGRLKGEYRCQEEESGKCIAEGNTEEC